MFMEHRHDKQRQRLCERTQATLWLNKNTAATLELIDSTAYMWVAAAQVR